ncbi:DUF1343 domain-containing protein [Planctomycetales bacterium ZRK34]|nr:DUF1343 domain-containing protein [Planctomycetales bacterium ZRK34]
MKLRWIVLAVCVCAAVGRGIRADVPYPMYVQQAEAAIDKAIRRGHIPGAVLVMGNADGVTYRKAFGHRTLRPKRTPMTPDTVFDAASLTKPLATAICVMKLIEQNKLALTDPVAKYLPAFGTVGKQTVTIEQLLLHRSGLEPANSIDAYANGHEAALQNIYNLQLEYEPGERFVYSDLGYIVLGELVAKVSGKPLNVFAHDAIYQPLGMNDTTFNPPADWRDRIAPTTFTGRVHDPRAAALGGVAGHAGVFTTADDIARYCRMIIGGGELDGRRILSELTVDLMIEPRCGADRRNCRALGFDVDTGYSSARGRRFTPGVTFGHTGFTGTMFWIDPVNKCYVVMLTNRLHAGDDSTVPLYRAVSTAAAKAMLGPLRVWNGIDVLAHDDFKPLTGQRVGLITNHTGIDRHGWRTIDLMQSSKSVNLVALFSPEHGLFGAVDEKVGHSVDPKTGLKVFSLYGETRRPTPQMLEGIDTLVFDIQDIGTRFYTYIATMAYAMEAAGKAGVKFVVLDRPNPIAPLGATGPLADVDRLGFTAAEPIPVTHGMTVGELARMFKHEYGCDCELLVVPMGDWRRDLWFDETALPWINPSPNMRNPTQAALYPAIGLIESTNLSVGRGTDEPFERFGAPWIESRQLAVALNESDLPGLRFVPIAFVPESSKFAGETCQGVHIIVTDREALQPVESGLTIARVLRDLYGEKFDAARVLNLLASAEAQTAWQTTGDPSKLSDTWSASLEAFGKRRAPYLIYR